MTSHGGKLGDSLTACALLGEAFITVLALPWLLSGMK